MATSAANPYFPNPYFQVGLDVFGRRCVVLGGGDEAEKKSARLVEAGACVTVVSPVVTAALAAAAERGEITWHPREADLARDLHDTFLAMNTIRSAPEDLDRVREACRQHHVLLNSYDAPARSDFGMAALVSKGHLRVSISSSNASPALASRIRRHLEDAFDEEFVDYLDALGRIRARLKERVAKFSDRRSRLRSLVEGFNLEVKVVLPKGWRQLVEKEWQRTRTRDN